MNKYNICFVYVPGDGAISQIATQHLSLSLPLSNLLLLLPAAL